MPKPYPEAIAHYPQSMQIFVKEIHNRIESGKNALIGIFGQTGGGKSLVAVAIMIALYEYRFGKTPDDDYVLERVMFKAKDFLKRMNDPNLKKKEDNLWDEVGVDAGHKSHASNQNKIIGWLAQTFRNLQQVVFFTTPSIAFIDASVRKLLHYYIEVVTIDKKKKVCVIKPLKLQYNVRMDKLYYHNLTVKRSDGYVDEVEFASIPKISDELEMKYEGKKNQFTSDLNLKIQDLLQKIEDKEGGAPLRKLTERQEKILELLKSGVIKTNDIAEKIGVPAGTISINFGYLRNKGVNIDKYRNPPSDIVVLSKNAPAAS